MLLTILYGFSIGSILYFISIGLSLTFGTMRVINFAHTVTYSIGVYVLITCIPLIKGNFIPAAIMAILAVIPVSYVIERYVIRRLYGESLDYGRVKELVEAGTLTREQGETLTAAPKQVAASMRR